MRRVVDLTVSADVAGHRRTLVIYDLSMDGCMVDTGDETELLAGSPVTIDLLQRGAAEGTLIWTRGRFGGLQFLQRLDTAVVERLGFKPPPQATNFTDRFGRMLGLPGERYKGHGKPVP